MKKISVMVMIALEAVRTRAINQVIKVPPNAPYLIMLALSKPEGEDKKKEEEEDKLKPLTKKEVEAIKTETKVKLAAMLAVPPAPYETIIPAPGLSHKNPIQLCSYVADKFPRISAITDFASVSPSVASVTAIYTALLPLANINNRKISGSDLSTRETLTKQLRQQFLVMMNSCAILANGNKALFLLTDVNVRRKGQPHNETLPAPVFRILYNKGTGKLGIVIDKIEFAKDYTVWYGPGKFDRATWLSQSGQTRQVITGQTPGAELNIFVVANGKMAPGNPSNPQSGNVPFN